MDSSTLFHAMNRRANAVGLRIPYRDAASLSRSLFASRWKKVLEALASITDEYGPTRRPGRKRVALLVRPAWRDEQVLDRPRVEPEDVALTHTEPAALEDDDPACFQRFA